MIVTSPIIEFTGPDGDSRFQVMSGNEPGARIMLAWETPDTDDGITLSFADWQRLKAMIDKAFGLE